jgi:hypothetical protein
MTRPSTSTRNERAGAPALFLGHLADFAGDAAGKSPGLLTVLARVADLRHRRDVRHRLAAILRLAVCAVRDKGQGDVYLKTYCAQAANGTGNTSTFLGERLRRLSRSLGAAAAMPATTQPTSRAAFAPHSPGHADVLPGQVMQPGTSRQRHHRDQPAPVRHGSAPHGQAAMTGGQAKNRPFLMLWTLLMV